MSSKASKSSPAIDFRELFDNLLDGCMLLDATVPDFRIVAFNKAYESLTGVTQESAFGRPVLEVFPYLVQWFGKTTQAEVHRMLRTVVRTGKPKRLKVAQYEFVDGGGVHHAGYRQSVYQRVLGDEQGMRYLLVTSRDMTQEQRAIRQAARIEHRLEAALSVGKVSSWLWYIDDDRVVGDRSLAKLFGLGPREIEVGMSLQEFLSAIYPEDRPGIEQAIRRSIEEETVLDEEYRVVTAAGKMRWVLARGKVEKQDGKLVFPGVIVDITERRDLQAQVELARQQDQLNRQAAKILQERNDELEAIARSKDEFVALASHQLRTPATAVKQYLGMVLQGYVGDISDVQTEMLEKAFESNERQIQIINQILNAARVDTGRLTMILAPLDICTVLQGVSEDMRGLFAQRQQRFSLRLPKGPVWVRADWNYLRMAVENVIHNASVYTPEGGSVTVRLSRTTKQAKITVADTGVGIRKTDLGKLFVKFSRIHNPLSVQAGGSGIGLYLTAEIVRLHEGKVYVMSRFGAGTTFTIVLPLQL